MPRRSTPTDAITFEAALHHAGQCLTFDKDGEATLKLALGNADGAKLAGQLHALQGDTFYVSIVRRDALTSEDG